MRSDVLMAMCAKEPSLCITVLGFAVEIFSEAVSEREGNLPEGKRRGEGQGTGDAEKEPANGG